MKAKIRLSFLLFFSFLLISCEETKENPLFDFQKDFQPLAIGNLWVYQVLETEYFGENDSEDRSYFVRDFIRSSYVNEVQELVYILERSNSVDKINWTKQKDYTLLIRNNSLVRTIDNQAVVPLVFPLEIGKTWNGYIYQADGDDSFEIESYDNNQVKVNQEESDDLVTYRDIRFEIFQREIGLTEKYEEVVTYCSRNDCLGDQLIDGGYKRSFTLVDYVKN